MVVVLTKGLWACKYMEETNRSYLLDMQRSPLRDAGLIFLLWHIFGAIFHLFHRQILPFELFSINVGVCTFSKMEWHISLVTDTATTHLPRQLLSVHTLYTLNRPKIRSAKSTPSHLQNSNPTQTCPGKVLRCICFWKQVGLEAKNGKTSCNGQHSNHLYLCPYLYLSPYLYLCVCFYSLQRTRKLTS